MPYFPAKLRAAAWAACAAAAAALPLAAAPPSGGAAGRGAAAKAEVFAISDSGATHAFLADGPVVRRMTEAGLRALTGRATTAAAWRALVRTNDVVGFKVTSAPGAVAGTRLEVVRALAASLLAAGQAPSRIVIWDRRLSDLQRAGWPALAAELGVRCAGAEDAGWDRDSKPYDHPAAGRLVAGDLDFGRNDAEKVSRLSHVSRLLTRDVTRIVTVAPVLSHNAAGVNGHLIGLALGSVDNILRFAGANALLAEAVPELCALDDVNGRVAFGVSDALVCQYRGEETTMLHYAEALNELRFSRDLVALDALALADVDRARQSDAMPGEKPFKTELYNNAEVIELGIANRARIEIRHP